MPDSQNGYWETVLFQGGEAQAGNPDAACQLQHQSFNPNATYQTPVPVDDDDYGCRWIARQFGGPDNSNTILPSLVRLHCPDQYYAKGGLCAFGRAESPECGECGSAPVSGPPTPQVGNPMSVTSGFKKLSERDYESADGLLTVDRDYLSRPGRPWNVLMPGYIAVSGYWTDELNYHSPKGELDQFVTVNRDDTTFTYYSRGPTRRTISIVATPTVGRGAYFSDTNVSATGAGEVRLDMSSGEYILFRRANGVAGPDVIRRLVPVERGMPGGYTIWYDYSDTGFFPYQVRDSLGRQMALTWIDAPDKPDFDGAVTDKVIEKIDLPDTTKLLYAYDFGESEYTGSFILGGTANFIIPGKKNRLRSVEHQTSTGTMLWKRSYDYSDQRLPNALTAIMDQNDQTLASYTYNGFGLLLSSELAGGVNHYDFGHQEYYQYNDLNSYYQRRRVTNPLGRTEDYTLYRRWYAASNAPRVITRIDATATATTPADSIVYDYVAPNSDDHILTAITDRRGVVTYAPVDTSNRRPTSIIDANGTGDARTTNLQWHTSLDLPTRIERGGLRIDYSYNSDALVTSQTLTDISSQSVPYATNGQTRTTTYSWGTNRRLLSVNGPRSVNGLSQDDITTFTYDTGGNLLTMTNGLGQVTSYGSYDANGRPGSMTGPNGTQTLFTYDALGHLLTSTVKDPASSLLNAITSYEYDVEGRVTGITQPGTQKMVFTYDLAGQLLQIASADNEQQNFSHDAMGNIIQEKTKASNGTDRNTIARTFDSLGRMLTETLGAGRTTTWEYDKNGNPVQLTSPRNFDTDMAFDPLNRLVSTVAPDAGTTATAYNPQDNITSITDPVAVQTTFVRNGFGEVIQEVSPDRGTNVYYYDAAGDLSAAIDGRGQRIDYSRDILGRVTAKTPVSRPTSEIVTYAYDSGGVSGCACIGRLASMTDASGTTSFGYDHRGNLTAKVQPIGALSWTYDLADRIVQTRYPSGRDVAYTRDDKGRVTEVKTRPDSGASWTVLASNIAYEPFGPMKSADFGNGLKLSQDWGSDRRLASKRLYTSGSSDVWHVSFSYDGDDNITAITDLVTPANSRSFDYDSVDRLARVDGGTGGFAREDYVHDKNGNLTTVERRVNVTDASPAESDTHARTSGTNRISSVTHPGGTRSFTHDARGNLIADTRPAGAGVTLGYDGHARLASYARAGAETQAMLYNGFDERVGLTTTLGGSPVDERRYAYDVNHRIVGEYGATTSDLRAEYIWLLPEVGGASPFGGDDGLGGYMPLAVAVPDVTGIKINWVQGNHLGTPVVTTDVSGAVVTPTGYDRIGFPGQVEQHADLYYNYYRDYDPTLGRYVQADPIGLGGGNNPYLYVGANPLKGTDPLGLGPEIAFCAFTGPAAPACVGIDVIASGLVLVVGAASLNQPDVSPRPQGMTRLEERQYDRYCSRSDDPCGALKAEIRRAITQARLKMVAMHQDKGGLFGSVGWATHAADLSGRMNAINAMISLGKKMGCDMSAEIQMLSGLMVPRNPR